MLKKDNNKEDNFDFENSIKELEKIVIKLEESENSLEESLRLFEKGTKLAEGCYKFLDAAEQKVTKLISVKNKD